MRLEQVLGDNDIEVEQFIPYIGTGKVKVKQEVENFSVIGRVEFGIKVKDRYSISFTPSIRYNPDYTSYGGKLLFKKDF
jgi:hypothetical protein